MKRKTTLLVFFMVVAALPYSLRASEDAPDWMKILPECIWAAASGGGTWMTEIQLTSMSSSATVNVTFYYGGGNFRGPFTLTTGLARNHSVRYGNILQTLDGLDAGSFSYYGKIGAVRFFTSSPFPIIQVTAKTSNGNFGKTFPGLSAIAVKTAAQGRPMRIPFLINNTAYRTFTGFYNTSPVITYTVSFSIISSANVTIGSFTKAFIPYEYLAFNPFVEAGVSGGVYDNCWLYIDVTAGGSDAPGIMGYGAIANNTSNDPSALIAYPFL